MGLTSSSPATALKTWRFQPSTRITLHQPPHLPLAPVLCGPPIRNPGTRHHWSTLGTAEHSDLLQPKPGQGTYWLKVPHPWPDSRLLGLGDARHATKALPPAGTRYGPTPPAHRARTCICRQKADEGQGWILTPRSQAVSQQGGWVRIWPWLVRQPKSSETAGSQLLPLTHKTHILDTGAQILSSSLPSISQTTKIKPSLACGVVCLHRWPSLAAPARPAG